MGINKNEILDDKTSTKIFTLTDFQLIGLNLETDKYPKEIADDVEDEIERRKISNDQLKEFKEKFQKFEIVDRKIELLNGKMLVGLIFLIGIRILTKPITAAVCEITIIAVCLLAVRSRFYVGYLEEKRIWRLFRNFMLLLIGVLVVWTFLK